MGDIIFNTLTDLVFILSLDFVNSSIKRVDSFLNLLAWTRDGNFVGLVFGWWYDDVDVMFVHHCPDVSALCANDVTMVVEWDLCCLRDWDEILIRYYLTTVN